MSGGRHQTGDSRDRAIWALSSLVVLSAVAYLPLLLNPGLVNTRAGGDSPFLLVRVQQLVTTLRAGVFPVRWMPDAAYGLGYPFFNYYASLPFYVAALFHFLGFGIIGAIKAAQVLGFLAAAAGMFLLARQLLSSRSAAFLASVAYTYAPFHLINIYVRGDSLGEFYAFAFYPLVFLALYRLRERRSSSGVAFLALAYGGLVLSHNLSALIFSPFVLAQALFLAGANSLSANLVGTTSVVPEAANSATANGYRTGTKDESGEQPSPGPRVWRAVQWTIWPLVGLALGMGLSAWYWGPALMERGLVQLEQNLTGYFHYAGHFRRLNLVQPALLFDYNITGQRTPFAMGLVPTLLTLLAVLAVAGRFMRQRRRSQSTVHDPLSTISKIQGAEQALLLRFVFVLGGARRDMASAHCLLFTGYWLLATVLITPLSRPIWDHLPLLPFVQFPWRFLSVQSFFGSLLIGYLVTLPQRRRWRGAGTYTLAFLLLISAMAGLRVEVLSITDADVTRERLALYELFTANIGSTVRAEYLPQWVEPRPYTSAVLINGGRKPPPVVTVGQLSRPQLVSQSPTEERWRVTISSPEAELTFFTLYFPGWRGYVDGSRVQIGPAKGSGLIRMRVPQGRHEVVLRFWLTRRRAAAEGVSLLAVLVVLGALAWGSGVLRCSVSTMIEIIGRNTKRVGNVFTDSGLTCFQRVSSTGGAFQRSVPGPRADDETLTLLALAVIVFLLSATVLWLSPHLTAPSPSPLSMDFARMPYLHANPGGVRFGDDLRLVDYDYPDRARAGQTLTVTLRWEGDKPDSGHLQSGLQVEVALVSPAFHLFGVPDVLARGAVPLEAATVHELEIPPDVMPGPYLILVKVRDRQGGEVVPRTDAGEGLGTTFLRPLSLDLPADQAEAGPGAVSEPGAVLGRFGQAIRLTTLSYKQVTAQWLRVNLMWWTGMPVTANYKTSVRLKDETGQILVQTDTQPLYGFYPTTAWRSGLPVADRRWLSLPPELPSGNAYRIEVVLYEVPSLQALGTAEISGVALNVE